MALLFAIGTGIVGFISLLLVSLLFTVSVVVIKTKIKRRNLL